MTEEPFVFLGQMIRMEVSVNAALETTVVVVVEGRGSAGHSVLTLLGVDSLQVSQRVGNWPLTIEIVDIRDRQLEGLNFIVTDSEEGILSCLCAEFDVGSETVS
jgi:hypothetical protein